LEEISGETLERAPIFLFFLLRDIVPAMFFFSLIAGKRARGRRGRVGPTLQETVDFGIKAELTAP
jgi:hypothetical protein